MDRAMKILVMFVTATAIHSITRHRLVVRIHPSSLPRLSVTEKPIRTCSCSSLQTIYRFKSCRGNYVMLTAIILDITVNYEPLKHHEKIGTRTAT